MADKMMRVASRNEEGKARALRSNEYDSLIIKQERSVKELEVETTDFLNKRLGDLTIPHVAKRGSFEIGRNSGNDRVNYPLPDSEGWSEFTNERYGLIYKEDGLGTSVDTNDIGKTACQLYTFNILEHLKNTGRVPKNWTKSGFSNNIKNIEIEWVGRGLGDDNGCEMLVYLPIAGEYASFSVSHAYEETKRLVIDNTNIGVTPPNFYNSAGELSVLVKSANSASQSARSYIYTDYIKVNIEFVSEYTLTDVSRAFDDDLKALRVLDKDKKAYDESQDRLKVIVEDSITRKTLENMISFDRQPTQVETLWSGTVEGGGGRTPDNEIVCRYRGEKETRILVTIDKQPWSMQVSATPFGRLSNITSGTTYPEISQLDKDFPDERAPLHVLPIYKNAIDTDGSWEVAYKHRQLNDFQIVLWNASSENANVIIKVMRIYK